MSSYQGTTLPSVAALSQKTEAPESQGSRREDWRKAKELEEARKAGTAPALVDEEGKDINPHIPQYIATVPWYVGIDKPTLKHQRPQRVVKDVSAISNWYKKGVQEGTLSTKFRKGACENCGSLTHKKKDCVERPRKVGAKFSGEDLAPDEHLQPNLHFDYDGKRDRWNGYNPEEHEAVVEEYAKMEEAKKQLKAKKLQNEMISVDMEKERDSDESDADEDKYADSFDMPGTNFDSKRRITVRNLRIREDTAKYLYNLRPNSAYYDPKTRSMRDNPSRDVGANPDDLKFAGDNFIREGGDTVSMAKAQMFAWDASNRGTDVHLQAEPTKLDLLHKEFGSKKDNFKKSQKETILQRYGGEEHLEAPPKQLLLAQTEEYVEYSRHGTIIKGQEKAPVKSKYEEDVLLSNHFSVWGSFWRDGQWGFRCCYSLVRGSYCTGAAGRMAATEDSVVLPTEPTDALPGIEEEEEEEEEPVKSMVEQHKEKLNLEKEKKKEKRRKKKRKQKELRKQKEKEEKKKKKKKKRRHSSSDSDSSDSSSDDSSEEEEEQEDEEAIRKRKIKEAMKRQEEHEKEVDKLLAMDERKRPYNSLNSYDSVRQPTEEEMEAYRLKRARMEDPMAAFLKPY
ncbi:pre-mRNA-splicing factor SLU7 [Strongylocentrotus purpuratus]|uniref:Pre-mRNA-splicing factor SLU7 n=1 Tax=Strongylocentrotus purpuratus TaxID=7668 RepID=A0A7M7P9P5_STRPU|nr:pre-mRNA-splicing factor SLU7 [Strongylocentrotus purpuratus]XP_030848400.1 pre-mRNA-splicing factor SLU7 [Strongylocentrotus purpuratus]XP_030848401.1 pre-mRNA-splicing factor SLU7 [Strongylocentrotus purpuratus]XP_030848402.1 pre-mRNA-splicing factor SLU7 [Strongylocentrotus purpuratus]